MTYFSNLPTIFYDFNIGGDNEVKIIRDISANVRFNPSVLSNITTYEEYDVCDNETPEIVSEKLYGTPMYHWVIMLLNERFDYINDWPLSSTQLQSYVVAKYGAGNELSPHHYVDAAGRTVTSTSQYYDPHSSPKTILCNTTAGSNVITSVNGGDFSTLNDGSSKYVAAGVGITQSVNENVTSFSNNSTVVLNAPATETSGQYGSAITFTKIIVPQLTPVSNYAYESDVNETKRRIKVVDPSVIGIVATQLRVLMNE